MNKYFHFDLRKFYAKKKIYKLGEKQPFVKEISLEKYFKLLLVPRSKYARYRL